ncbi:poly(ADP-ribose) glycohydrolase isoform X2 [Manduca sexta]|nr:poly(ADP-ribose) glycohydrolase isoform X2 [Manduca sexta]XP_037298375.1 poly(ADP-ribose) glycohydrolase isoform X2 [Manduca sexta]KAG6462644.1 hypothetical protein O3G_MSEX013389 [Manduca sexta]KAG6462645.1 hypothetical protein O3G_MSEX013389 [Manduca sexta]
MSSESSEGSDSCWRGVPITEIYGSGSPWGSPEFPLVVPSRNHAVLYHVRGDGSADTPPKPQIGQDKWDQDHVRLPCSPESLYPVENSNGETRLKKRWKMIEHALQHPITNSKELAEAIISYNTKFKKIWKFKALHKFFNEYLEEEESQYFFDVTLPEIAKLALSLPKLVQSPIPLLKQNMNISISLSQQQISCLLANAFFCTYPRRNTRKRNTEYSSYPHINFSSLYECRGSSSVMEKLKCLCHYFKRVCTKVPVGVVTVWRRSAGDAVPAWDTQDASLAALPLHVDSETTIENAHGLIQVDFANRYLGGGVLTYGCVQEEIRFVICPELIVTMLFTEMMKPDEAVLILGCERYSEYSGYSNSFSWTGAHGDVTPRDSAGRRRCAVLAVDAKPYAADAYQYQRDMVDRELTKAWVGFSFHTEGQCEGLRYPGIGTGNWGCGAYRGSPRLKSLLQAMVCASLRRPMAYYTFGDPELRDEIIEMYNTLSRYNVTVGQLYKYLIQYSETDMKRTSLYSYLNQVVSQPSENNDQEFMDISSTSETSQLELSGSLQKEFLKDFGSPDMFSQESEPLVEIVVDTNDNKKASEQQSKRLHGDNSLRVDVSPPLQHEENKSLIQPSRLLDEMQKLDDSLQLHSSPSGQRSGIRHDADTSIRNKSQLDATAEMKKKVNKRITDYFSKKT